MRMKFMFSQAQNISVVKPNNMLLIVVIAF